MGTESTKTLVVLPPVPTKCFKDRERECDASCMAHQLPPEDLKHHRWSFCKLLVDSERSVKYLKVVSQSMDTLRTYLDDEKRFMQPTPPRVR